ncbi:MAG: hypothetical protein G8345_13175 [Magnetococcales bacterium]|nr:hypothetical protein [Magnetococcales bacterium]NGZ27825.1 hypothetical protein [Magnetococcales bacterium]
MRGAVLLNLVLWLTLLSMWLALMASLLVSGGQTMTELVHASRASSLALGVTTLVEKDPCASQTLNLSIVDMGEVTVSFSGVEASDRQVTLAVVADAGRLTWRRGYDCTATPPDALTAWLPVNN